MCLPNFLQSCADAEKMQVWLVVSRDSLPGSGLWWSGVREKGAQGKQEVHEKKKVRRWNPIPSHKSSF